MEIVIKVNKKKKALIARNRDGDGAIRIGGEGCDAIMDVMERFQFDYRVSVKEVATAMLVAAAENITEIKVEEAETCQE